MGYNAAMLRILAIALRIPFALAGAFALLYALSYPDSIIPPDAARQWEQGFTLYTLRGYVWVLPWLFTEVVCMVGPRRNLVWFTGMLAAFTAAVIAWPVLTATHPELVFRTMEHEEGGMLSLGLLYFSLILFGSVLVRFVFLRFLFAAPLDAENTSGDIDAAVLDPAKARTVRQIAADPVRVTPKFRFGEGDEGVVQKFRVLMRRLFLKRCAFKLCLLAVAAAIIGWFFLYPQPTEEQALQRDLRLMKENRRFKGVCHATPAAVYAAYRVMEYVDSHDTFKGMSKAEAEHWLGLDTANPYEAMMRDERDLSIPSVDDTFESRDRFLTVSTAFSFHHAGLRNPLPRRAKTALLYIRTDESGERINVVEVQDSGFNDVYDEQRHRMGTGWNRSGFYRH